MITLLDVQGDNFSSIVWVQLLDYLIK